ncbi:hypothetical protein GCM10025882_05660 [Acinetobacter gyllenbergii]|uniref:Uncharacterized protein n=1 Tax=Acinetobacter gyllenbergii CIP 110306 = MTCC 11365 TaxID=1217657 RepID=A0A829HMC6_9GAMM|nr:hypothetical protein [Acinetobacter gyllenbergii]EPF93116.1 hypothetical protein F957_00462 [Acinetobacter gyllenbergii CIP 110306 = MTCC 11365]EPH31426.1 putative signal peptide protein [Acinetobacter gyllenbergii CIP 110306 = MTCC 11365]ESK36788.1 hypothetical protein F987_03601 [Acinetobacter gyllenbergii NIPH 230]MCU4579729.1 hypothetical protein [Acinetobacter gyllenbergii]OBY74320.1 signal peptide protein [Acinetobacter gyllenbergii]
MKQIAAFLLVLIALGVVVFYFEPAEPNSSTDDTAVYQIHPEPSGGISTVLHQEEVKTTEHTTSHMLKKLDKTQENNQFYDTKSDPSIQPIDPETDPANEIKKL